MIEVNKRTASEKGNKGGGSGGQESYLRAIIENSQDIIIVLNEDLTVRYANSATRETLGFALEEFEGEDLAAIFQRREVDDWEALYDKLLKDISEPGSKSTVEFEISHRDGTRKVLEAIGKNLVEDPTVNGMVVNVRDVTERASAEQALKDSEERFRILAEASSEGIAIHDRGLILDANRALAEMVGVPVKELIGRQLINQLPGEVRERVREAVESDSEEPYEVEVERLDGTVIRAEIRGKPITVHGEKLRIAAARDLTDRAAAEAERLKNDKLESIGVLAGGLAHDFNNLLTTIMGSVSLAMNKMGPEHEDYELLEAALSAGKRAAGLTGQMLSFTRGGAPIKEEASLEELVRETVGFASRGSSVKFEVETAEDLPAAKVDKVQLSQVVQNLLVNAIQASIKGAAVKVEIGEELLDTDAPAGLRPGPYLRLSVIDSGEGIPPENLDRIFDPYFSTRETGRGLGLASAFYIVKRHGGAIEVDSAPGKGTRFDVYIPASAKRGRHKAEAQNEGADAMKILVMDDERQVRNVFARMIKFMGHTVDECENGEEALKLYSEAIDNGAGYDLVFLDLTVAGGMGGKKTIEKLLEMDPDVKAIVYSGYYEDPVMAEYKSYGFKGVLRKPAKLDEVEQAINKAFSAN